MTGRTMLLKQSFSSYSSPGEEPLKMFSLLTSRIEANLQSLIFRFNKLQALLYSSDNNFRTWRLRGRLFAYFTEKYDDTNFKVCDWSLGHHLEFASKIYPPFDQNDITSYKDKVKSGTDWENGLIT